MSLPLVTASGVIENKRLFIRGRKFFDREIAELPDGLEVGIEVYRHRAARSRLQDGYYFGVVLQMLSELTAGDTSVDDWHTMMKAKFLSKNVLVTNIAGEIVEEFILGQSIRGLTTVEFSDYVEKIRRYAATELGLFIPDPDPSWREHKQEAEGYGHGV